MRATRVFWKMFAALLGVLFVMAGHAMAFDVSGTVSNSTGKSGRIYLSVQYSGGGGTGIGVSIPSPGTYTIRGVPNGTYNIQAFMDTQVPEGGIRHASDPVGYSPQVMVNNANVTTGADVTLKDPSPPVLSPPASVLAMPGNALVFVMWDAARGTDGAETARLYTVYWSDTPNPGPANFKGKSADLPSSTNSGYVASGLTNGASYYFAVTSKLSSGGTESAPANANGGAAITVGPVSSGYKVSGTVDSTGIAKGSTPLWVAAVVHDKGPVAFTYIANPADKQTYTITGVAPGTYDLYAILDMNNDGAIDAGDYMTADSKATSIAVTASDLSGADFALAPQDTDVTVTTGHWSDGSNQGYSLELAARGVHKLPVNVSVSGPQLGGTIDMAADGEGGGRFRTWTGVPNPPAVTPTPDSYSFMVAYADGTNTGSTGLSAPVTAVLNAFPTPTAPMGPAQSSTPTFTWNAPANPPTSPYYYRVDVDGNGMYWSSQEIPANQLSLPYNTDGMAPQLMPGAPYSWSVSVQDAQGNSASGSKVNFTAGSATGTAQGTYTYDATTGTLALTWNNVNFVCQGPKMGTETDTVTALSDTTLSWVDPNDSSNTMTWTRSTGTAGNIVGTWNSTDSNGNSFTLTFNSDGSMAGSGTIMSCGNQNPSGAMAQVVNNTGAPLYQVMVGSTPFSENLASCGNGCSTSFVSLPVASYPVSVQATTGGSPVQAGSLSIPGSGPSFSFNIKTAGNGYCTELWQRSDSTLTFNNDLNKMLVGSTCGTTGGGSMPYISGFNPVNGGAGTVVTINGTGFGSTPGSVQFNGFAAGSIGSWSDTQIVATVSSATTGSGPVTVKTAAGTSASYGVFSVGTTTGGLYIAGFTPQSGTAGTSVTINGGNFDQNSANDIVAFNGVAAAVTSASSTTLVATVPNGASNGPISVQVGGITTFSPGQFMVITGPISISGIVKNSAGTALAGATVQVVGSSTLSAVSAADGSFTIGNIPAAQPFTVKGSITGANDAYIGPFNNTVNITGKTITLFTNTETAAWGLTSGKGVVTGKVTDNSNGANLSGATVTASSSLHPSQGYAVAYFDGTNWGGSATYGNGKFMVLNVDAGDSVTLNASLPQYKFPSRTMLTYADGVDEFTFQGIFLSGGILSVSPTALSFSDPTGSGSYAPQTITFTNTGTGNLNVQSSTITGDASSFSVEPGGNNPCPSLPHTFLPNDSCTLVANFTPVAPGSHNATLQVSSDASNGSMMNIGLSGSAVSVQTGSISGNITDTMGAALPYVNVQVSDTASAMTYFGYTDQLGNYIVNNVPSGTYRVQFNYRSGLVSKTVWYDKAATPDAATPVTVTAPNATTGINAALDTTAVGGYTLSGHLYDAKGLGVCGGNLNVSGMNGSVSTVTAADGSYTLSVPAGSYSLSLNYYPSTSSNCSGTTYPQYAAPMVNVSVSADQVQDFSLPAVYTVSGKIVDANGAAVPGAYINFNSSASTSTSTTTSASTSPSNGGNLYASTTSASDGSYTIGLYGATYMVNLSKDSTYVSIPTPLVVNADLTQDFTFAAAPSIPQAVISSFTPASGKAGDQVTITGSGFGSAGNGNSVYFNGMYAQASSWSDTEIVATVPYGAMSGPISINTQGIYASSSQPFTVLVDPPKIVTTVPASGATGMPANGGVMVFFDKEMNVATVNSQTFTVKDDTGAAVAGSVQWGENGFVFAPANAFAFGKSYTVNLATGIKSADGAALAAPYSWSFTVAQSLGNSFSLQGGIYNLQTSYSNNVPSYFYDVIQLASDTTHLTDSWYSWMNGAWSPATSQKTDQGYTLTDSGWVQASDSPDTGTVVLNSDGTFTWTNSTDGASQQMEPIEYNLAGQPLANYVNPSDLPAAPTGTYPAGSMAWVFKTTTLTDQYRVGIWTKEPGMPDQNYVQYSDASYQQHTVTNLSDLPTIFAPGSNNWLYSNGGINMQLAQDGTVQLSQSGFQGPTPLTVTGSWKTVTVKGQPLLVVTLPQQVQYGQNGDLFYAAINGVVKQGEWIHAGTVQIDTNPNYNQAAFNWLIGGGAAPTMSSQTIGSMTFSSQSMQVGGTSTVTAMGGASGNPVVFTSATPGVCTVSGSTITAVAPGTCTIAANQGGNSSYYPAAQVTTNIAINAAVPGAPMSVSAMAGNGSATVSFAKPASDGGSAITAYTVTSTPGGFSATGTASPITVKGLANGTAYTFTVTATNSVGASVASTVSNSVTPVTAPDAPTAVAATGADGSATVSFTAPKGTGGSPITGYTVTSTPGNISATGTASPIVVKGLANGTTYTFTVTAANANGNSLPSMPSAGALVATVPGTPAAVTATVGDAHATVSFVPPAMNGGAQITGYTVTSTPGNITATGTTTPIVVNGLANGTTYTFTVTATNVKGSGAPSAPSNSVMPDVVPGAPTAVSASAGNAQATVSFTAPVSNGGSTITGYTVTSTPGGISATGTASPVTVTGLANGTTYTFTVTAKNSKGSGTPSAPCAGVTPDVVPGAPTNVAATHGNASAMVSFTAPQPNGGTAVKNYIVTSTPGNIVVNGAASPISVAGLTNGTAYTFMVVAVNAKGSSAPSAASAPVTPVADLPGAPAMIGAKAGNASATVTFGAPASNGGSDITGYTVTSIPAGGVDANAGTTALVHNITGLNNGTTYTFTVTATNSSGNGAASAPSNFVTPVTVPGAPAGVSAVAEHGLARVSFSAPLTDGGSPITRYTVTSAPGGFSASGTASPITVMGLADGTQYTFTVTATSAVGTGPASDPSTAVTPADMIAPVVRTFSVAGSASALNGAPSVTVAVSFLTADDNVAVAGYLINESSSKPALSDSGWSATAPASYAIGSTAGAHTLYAWAKDGAGNISNPYAATVVVTPKDTIAPVILSGPTVTSVSDTTAVVEWQTNEPATGGANIGLAPSPTTGNKETGYSTSHSITLANLSADTTYYVNVYATDLSGNGPTPSKEIALHTKQAPDTVAPYIIAGPSVTAIGPDSATVQWSTNEPAQGQVLYGASNTLGQTAAETGFSTVHSVKITGLSAQTQYFVKVNATDLAGNGPRESTMTSFSTVALPDTAPPVLVERPMAVNVSDTAATILWKTDEPSSGVIMTFDGTNYGFFSDNGLSNGHSVTLTGLTASKSYSYKVICTDGSGNSMITNSLNFNTTAAPDTTPPVITEGPLVVSVTYQSASLRWSTDEPADSVIEYGTDPSFGNSQSDSTLVRSHGSTLSGLESGTTYYFRVKSTDAFGNGPTTSKVFTFTTALDPSYKVPVITVSPSVIYKTDTSMTIYWETDDPSDSVVEYGEGTTVTDRVSNSDMVTKHQITITNLQVNTSYKVVVSSTNMSGNTVFAKAGGVTRFLAMNLDMVFSDASGGVTLANTTTAAAPDTTAPVITVAPAVSGITDTQAVLTWTTDEIADSQVTYGVKAGTGILSAGDPTQVTSHTVILTNLAPSTTYTFTVGSTDPSGNGPTTSTTVEFTTAAAPDTTAPVFVKTNPSDPDLVITFSDATGKTTINWVTDEPATTQIKYGLSPDAMNSQAAGQGLATNHLLTLVLQPGTTYYAAAVAMDGSGNVSQSATLTFTTQGTLDVTEPTTTPSVGDGTYLEAQTVTLTADKPSNIYYTTDGTTPTTSSAQYNGPIVVARSKTIKFFAIDGSGNREVPKAVQLAIQYAVTATGDQNGTITCPSAVDSGTSAVCTVTPATGYQAATISGCGGSVTTNGYTTGLITGDCSISASFTPITYTVTPSTSGKGTIYPATAQTVNYGATTSFTVTPGVGFHIASVTGCGGTLTGNSYTIAAASASCTVEATFAATAPTGDLNGDGKVDIADAVRALQLAVQVVTPTDDDNALDVGPLGTDGKPAPDGKWDVGDALLILKKVVGLITW